MKKYRTGNLSYRPEIVEVEVDRESEKSVWVNGKRVPKVGTWANYFDSWDEAHRALLSVAEARVSVARKSLERANGVLGNIKGMCKPGAGE